MYRNQGASWIALGNPVGAKDSWEELIWRLRDLADQHDGHCAFYQIPADSLFHYVDLGMNFIKLGEEGLIDLRSFSLEDSSRKSLRSVLRRLENEGITAAVEGESNVRSLLPTLRKVSEEWLLEKKTAEKGFSLGFFSEEYLGRCPALIVRRGEEILAFANLWTTDLKEEISVDLMRHIKEAPNGVMDFLFINAMLWGKEQGYKYFNIGMAPLSGLEEKRLAPFWNKVGSFLYQHGEHFYNFEGLRFYKQKFLPKWEPRYLAYQGKLNLPRILVDTAALISGGLKNVLVK